MSSHDAFVFQRIGDVAADDAPARPSTIAVLPNTRSPMSTDYSLFGAKAPAYATDSLSRPITGSILPRRRHSVRVAPYFPVPEICLLDFDLSPLRAAHLLKPLHQLVPRAAQILQQF